MTHDDMRQFLYAVTIGQDYSDATLKGLGIPEKEWERLRSITEDIKSLKDMGDHKGARELADDWAAFLAGKVEDHGQPDDFDPDDPAHLDRIPRR